MKYAMVKNNPIKCGEFFINKITAGGKFVLVSNSIRNSTIMQITRLIKSFSQISIAKTFYVK